MKIAVCIKQTPSRDAPLRLDAASGWVREQDTSFETNEADRHALEAALCFKDTHNAEVIVISLGPERTLQILRDALAKGADRAIHILAERYFELEPMQLASAFAAALRDEHSDLIIAGLQSDDHGFGQTGVMLAELLELAHASIVTEIQIEGDSLHVLREVGDGWSEWVDMQLPCVLTVQAGINNPRYASMKGIMSAKSRPITRLLLSQLLDESLPRSQHTEHIVLPEAGRQTRFLNGSPPEIAAQLVKLLKSSST